MLTNVILAVISNANSNCTVPRVRLTVLLAVLSIPLGVMQTSALAQFSDLERNPRAADRSASHFSISTSTVASTVASTLPSPSTISLISGFSSYTSSSASDFSSHATLSIMLPFFSPSLWLNLPSFPRERDISRLPASATYPEFDAAPSNCINDNHEGSTNRGQKRGTDVPPLGAISLKPTRGLIVLIPGMGNSAIPGDSFDLESSHGLRGTYFGKVPVREFRRQGFRVFIPTGLDPVGEIAQNGVRAYKKLKAFYKTTYPEGDTPVYMIGHSAGGLFGLKILELNSSKIPIKKLILVSTPLEGSPIADVLFGNCLTFMACNPLQSIVTYLAKSLGLKGALQMRQADIFEFLGELELPSDSEISAVGGTQHTGLVARSGVFCPLCVSSNLLFNETSDGVVAASSAYGLNTQLVDFRGNSLPLKSLKSLHVPLGHHEQVFSGKMLRFLGHHNVAYVKRKQRKFYRGLANFLVDSSADRQEANRH